MAAISLDSISREEEQLTDRFRDKLTVNHDLDRTLVSFQANKLENEHRWCKYKEGFSASLIRYIVDRVGIRQGPVLDPFAGSGTTLFIASELGFDATGIELLPSSAEIVATRNLILQSDRRELADHLRRFIQRRAWEQPGESTAFSHLRITSGAFPPETEHSLGRYLHEAGQLEETTVARVLRFSALCILESISYTRKDGQYLRWDARSGRRQGSRKFDKGRILAFKDAISGKVLEIAEDLDPRHTSLGSASGGSARGEITLLSGSCLDILPTLPTGSFGALVTSPPYCNRYDYTRTYALELAMLGTTEEQLKALRQTMLTCTVENRTKEQLGTKFARKRFESATNALESQQLLQMVLAYLEQCREEGSLNNSGIPRMVRNYFLELAVLLADCARVLRPGAPLVLVNDNVRYQGAHIPVDLVLSEIATKIGFDVESIWVLPKGKGNSSQQMGTHGRAELRKCVYVWRAL